MDRTTRLGIGIGIWVFVLLVLFLGKGNPEDESPPIDTGDPSNGEMDYTLFGDPIAYISQENCTAVTDTTYWPASMCCREGEDNCTGDNCIDVQISGGDGCSQYCENVHIACTPP